VTRFTSCSHDQCPYLGRTFDGKFEDKDYAIAIFLRHIEEVKQLVPGEKLLVYDVKEGWEPLVPF